MTGIYHRVVLAIAVDHSNSWSRSFIDWQTVQLQYPAAGCLQESRQCHASIYHLQCESKKIPPTVFWNFFSKRLGIFNQYFTHLLCAHFYTRLQIFIQISLTLTKLCHT